MFVLQINKSDPRVLVVERLYAYAKNIYKMHVVWSSEWTGLNKMAQFRLGDAAFDIDMTNLDEIVIPWELFASECSMGKSLTVSFRGTWKGHIVIPTPTVDLGIVHKSSAISNSDYTPPAPPTQNIYDQLKEEILTKADDATFDKETRIFRLWANKTVISEFEIPGDVFIPDPGDGTITIPGQKGEDGFSPTVAITPIDGGHTVTFTDVNGEQSFDVMDGVNGSDGLNGKDGDSGDSAYEIAVKNGFSGTEQEWLESLKGAQGSDGEKGDSAYEIAVKNGFSGTEQEWLELLKGADGQNGSNGESAYDIAVRVDGFSGTEQEWLVSLKGEDGTDGESAYDIAVRNGFTGTEEEWIESLKISAPESIDWTSITGKPDLVLKGDLANVYRYKGSVANYESLPTDDDLEPGWVYNTEITGMNYAWNGYDWDSLGSLTPASSSTQGDGIPYGVIVMWSGSIDAVPSGWSLCDGQNGTPDLTNEMSTLMYIMKTTGGNSGGDLSGGTFDHSALINRELTAQHPIGAISGLSTEIERIPEPVEPLTNTVLEEILK